MAALGLCAAIAIVGCAPQWTSRPLLDAAISGAAQSVRPSPQRPMRDDLWALLINGGGDPGNNQLSHVEHLRGFLEVANDRGIPLEHIGIFSADGTDPSRDLTMRTPLPATLESFLLLGTEPAHLLAPQKRLENTDWADLPVEAARKSSLEAWFASRARDMKPGDTLLIYVTDHGREGKEGADSAVIVLWEEALSVGELREMVSGLDPGVTVVMVMSQCFSGAFADVALPSTGATPASSTCGFFSVPSDRPAYGCYPEGRAGGELGHGYLFIDRLRSRSALDDAHEAIVADDDSPDVPVRTSDVYLARLLSESAKADGVAFPALVDQLNQEVDLEGGGPRTRQLLYAVARAHGLPEPRTLAELATLDARLEALEKGLGDAEKLWDGAATPLAKANMTAFLEAHPEWVEQLGREAVTTLDDSQRAARAEALLRLLEPFTQQRDGVWEDLRLMRAQAGAAKQARWRVKVRRAALVRLATLMTSMAGQRLLSRDTQQGFGLLSAEQERFDGLRRCERIALGRSSLSSRLPLPEPLPTLEEDEALLASVRPPRLGIAYSAAETQGPGAVVVREVVPESAAENAGLRVGDVILGPPDAPFTEANAIKRWAITAPIDETLELRVLRGDKKRTLTVRMQPAAVGLEPD